MRPIKVISSYQIAKLLLVSITIVSLWTPLLIQLFKINLDETKINENRVDTPIPDFNTHKSKESIEQINGFLSDNLPYRSSIIRWSNAFRTIYLKEPSKYVVPGSDDWLFFKAENIFEDLSGNLRYNEEEITKRLEKFSEKQKYLAAREIGYLFVSVPNKSTIHKEKLPWWARLNSRETRLQQLYRANFSANKFNWLNLEPVLLDLKKSGKDAFWRNDTHWNGYALQDSIFAIYNAAQKWIPNLDPKVIFEHSHITKTSSPGDLANLLGIPEQLPKVERHQLSVTMPEDMNCRAIENTGLIDLSNSLQKNIILTKQRTGSGIVVVFHDSFLKVAKHSVNEAENYPIGLAFAECYHIWKRPTLIELAAIAEAFNPDLIIEERVERLMPDENSM